jgi:hypothetical protein
MTRIYLAGPYSGQEEHSFRCLTYLTGRLQKLGHVVFSPVTHSHPVARSQSMPTDHEFWMDQDLPFLQAWADELWVLKLPGWEESKGVQEEIRTAEEQCLTVRYCEPLAWMEVLLSDSVHGRAD